MEFTDEWLKEELIKLSKQDIASYPKFILQLLSSQLVFIEKTNIRTTEDYERVKKSLIDDDALIDVDENKAKVWRDMKCNLK